MCFTNKLAIRLLLKRYILFHRRGREGHHARAPSFSPWEPQATSSLWVGLGGLQATSSGQGRARKRTAPSTPGANGGITRRVGELYLPQPQRLSWAKAPVPGQGATRDSQLHWLTSLCNGRPGSPFAGSHPLQPPHTSLQVRAPPCGALLRAGRGQGPDSSIRRQTPSVSPLYRMGT